MMYFTCDKCHTQYPVIDTDNELDFYEVDGERQTVPNFYPDDDDYLQICHKCQKENKEE